MKVIDSLKLNKFKNVSVPRNKDLYSRVGGRVPKNPTSGFVSEYGRDKMQLLQDADDSLTKEFEESTQVH